MKKAAEENLKKIEEHKKRKYDDLHGSFAN